MTRDGNGKRLGVPAMGRVWIPVVVLLAFLCAGCGREAADERTEAPVVAVEVATARVVRVNPSLEYAGSIEARREASVGAMMSGQIRKIYVDVGDRVEQGNLLVEMAGEQLTQAHAVFAAVRKDWERMGRLVEKGAVTQQAFDGADQAYQSAKAAYELVLESTRIRAPFSGTVSATYFEEGEVFVLMPGGASSSPALVELVQTDTVRVDVHVAERHLPLVRVDLRAELAVDSYPGRVFQGSIRLVEPVLDPHTRTSRAEIAVANPDRLLRPGMYADVELALEPRDALVVPRDALVQQEGTGNHFAIVVENGTTSRSQVELGEYHGDYVEVVSGLKHGDLVVTAGRHGLAGGTKITIVSEEGAR